MSMHLKILLVSVLLVILFPLNTSFGCLDDEDILSKSKDFEEIKELETDIIIEADKAYRLTPSGATAILSNYNITVDYDNAVRVYIDYNFFEDSYVSEKRVDDIIDACDDNWYYAWQIPVYSEYVEKSVGVVVARQLSLNEEQRSYLSADDIKYNDMIAGKYRVMDATKISDNKTIMSYVKEIEKIIPDNSRIKIIGSQHGFWDPVGIVISDNKISKFFSLGYNYQLHDKNGDELETNRLYDYPEYYENFQEFRGTDLIAPQNHFFLYVESIVVLFMVLTIIVSVLIQIKKKNNRSDSDGASDGFR